jgi:hypothetical protein
LKCSELSPPSPEAQPSKSNFWEVFPPFIYWEGDLRNPLTALVRGY